MELYKTPFGSVLIISKNADPTAYNKAIEVLESAKNNSIDFAFFDTMADWRMCPYSDETGFIMPVIAISDDKEILEIIIPSSALCLAIGPDNAYHKFLSSISPHKVQHTKISEKDFMTDYKDNAKTLEEAKILATKKNTFFKKEISLEKPIQKHPRRTLYKLSSARDVINFSSLAKNIFLYKKEYFLEPKENVCLDDFFDKGSGIEYTGKALNIKGANNYE